VRALTERTAGFEQLVSGLKRCRDRSDGRGGRRSYLPVLTGFPLDCARPQRRYPWPTACMSWSVATGQVEPMRGACSRFLRSERPPRQGGSFSGQVEPRESVYEQQWRTPNSSS
jgi:hypothetical protein